MEGFLEEAPLSRRQSSTWAGSQEQGGFRQQWRNSRKVRVGNALAQGERSGVQPLMTARPRGDAPGR